ncbi:hypothetical protein [Lysobacter sp. ESA13C]|uniref:hypothetical protein n=1 Tax=Lysobacter sp. ESA13C TaxID=2862676 RepID=UPI001CBCBC3A|nr:hypothetical protein [Lysobacter sp. ESA13C]
MSGIFDLDTEGAQALDEQARLNPFDPSKLPPTAWAGSAEAVKGLLRPSAGAGRALLMAAAPFAQAVDEASQIGSDIADVAEVFRNPFHRPSATAPTTAAQDAYFSNVVDDVGSNAVDAWTADAQTMGTAAKALNMGTSVAGAIPQMIGMPSVFLGSSALDPSTDLVRQGVDAETAAAVGGVNFAVNAIGMRIPAAFGSTLTARVLSGGGANLAMGAAADKASSEVLEAGGYEQASKSFDVADPYARGLDLLMGAAFGWKAHIDAPKVLSPSQRDAVLVANNQDHQARRSLPGQPVSAGVERAHRNALDEAMAQVLAGDRVDVSAQIRAEDFTLRPEFAAQLTGATTGAVAASAAPGASYVDYRRALESGGNPNARNPESSATGADQFTSDTWRKTVAKAKPAWAEGLTDEQLLAARIDPAKSGEMALALDAENTAALKAAGQEVTHHTLYAAHHFGASKGVKFAKAAGDTAMADILTAQQLKANEYLRGKTKAEAIASWDERARKAGVEVAEVPRAADPMVADQPLPELPPLTALEASQIVDTRLAALDERAGTGRLSREEFAALREEDADLVAVLRDQEQQQATGTLPAPGSRLTQAEIKFVDQRRAEIKLALEGDRAAAGYQRAAENLRGRLEKLPDRDAAFIDFARSLREPVSQPRASRGRGADARTIERARATLDKLDAEPGRAADVGGLQVERVPEGYRVADTRSAAKIPEGSAPVAARSGQVMDRAGVESLLQDVMADRSSTTAESSLQSAYEVAAEAPNAAVLDGFDADGNPRYRPMSEVLAEIEAERQKAANDAEAFPAAVNCFLRRGGDAA